MPPKIIRQPAIVLEVFPVRDSDLMVTLLGKESGKTKAYARGARRSKNRFMGGIDVFDCGTMEISPNRSSERLGTLISIEDREIWSGLRQNLVRLSLASFCLEGVSSFTVEEDPETAKLFNPLFLSLRRLNSSSNDQEAFVIALYMQLIVLRISGFSILDAQIQIEEQTRKWFEEMIERRAPIVPYNAELGKMGFSALLSYSENTLGHPLRTARQILSLDIVRS